MRVEIDELEETVNKLKSLTSDMGVSVTKAKYNTYLPKGALGQGFVEQSELDDAHTKMKSHIQDVIDFLEKLIDDFSGKTSKVHGNIQEAEYDAKNGMNSGQSGPGK